jgi:ribosome-binding protein aMBF1 (putative translation factor)
MKTNDNVHDINRDLNKEFGPRGSIKRTKALQQAWEEYNASILLDARKKAGMTQQEVADKIGADKAYVSRIERGITIPTVVTLYKIVAALGYSLELREPEAKYCRKKTISSIK